MIINKQYFGFLIMFSLVACKKQPPMSDININCGQSTAVSANFEMRELATPFGWEYPELSTPTDTIFGGANVKFIALESDGNYLWYIGNESIHEQSFYRSFPETMIGQTISVTLVIDKTPNLICFPDDDGYDSITKQLFVVEKPDDLYATPNHLFEGNFRLKEINALDSVDVFADLIEHGQGGKYYDRLEITNVFGENEVLELVNNSFTSYRQWWFELNGEAEICRIFHKMDGTLEIEITNPILETTEFLFKGRKLD